VSLVEPAATIDQPAPTIDQPALASSPSPLQSPSPSELQQAQIAAWQERWQSQLAEAENAVRTKDEQIEHLLGQSEKMAARLQEAHGVLSVLQALERDHKALQAVHAGECEAKRALQCRLEVSLNSNAFIFGALVSLRNSHCDQTICIFLPLFLSTQEVSQWSSSEAVQKLHVELQAQLSQLRGDLQTMSEENTELTRELDASETERKRAENKSSERAYAIILTAATGSSCTRLTTCTVHTNSFYHRCIAIGHCYRLERTSR
jgi:hypothetical protein